MATIRWLGTATAVQQVSTATPANVEIGDVFNLIAGGVTLATFTATAATVANVTAGLTAAWNNSTHPYATGITATDQTTHVQLKADNAGVPFTVTSSVADGGGANTQTLTMATTTANAGPNVWTTATNWSGGSVPTGSDTVIFENNAVPVYWGIDQNATTLAELRILQSYTGEIGLPETKFLTSMTGNFANYDTSKTEYRETYLKIGATLLNIGQSVGYVAQAGSPRLKINVGSVQTTATIYDTCTSSSDVPLQPVRLLGTHASNAIVVYGGTVGVATTTSNETSTALSIYLNGGTVTLGPGVTWTALRNVNGVLHVNSPKASTGTIHQAGSSGTRTFIKTSTGTIAGLTVKAGTMTVDGILDCDGAGVSGGTLIYNATGTITTLQVDNGGTIDFSQSANTRSVTGADLTDGVAIFNTSHVSIDPGWATNGLTRVQVSSF